jgi:hemoglobin-like flavoprotein
MTPAQIRTIRTSFAKIAPILPRLAQRFYTTLLATAPELRGLWGGNDEAQQQKFVSAVTELVHRRSSMAMPVVGGEASAPADLRRHVGHGVQPEPLGKMRASLTQALREELGADFTPVVQQAWEAAFDVLAKGLLDAPVAPATADDSFFDRLDEVAGDDRADAIQVSEAAALHQFFR